MGVGRAQASKLPTLKPPRLIPVTDEIFAARAGTAGQTWQALRYWLQDESLRQAIGAVRPGPARTASVLRLLDVALLMLHSQSGATRNARARRGRAMTDPRPSMTDPAVRDRAGRAGGRFRR